MTRYIRIERTAVSRLLQRNPFGHMDDMARRTERQAASVEGKQPQHLNKSPQNVGEERKNAKKKKKKNWGLPPRSSARPVPTWERSGTDRD